MVYKVKNKTQPLCNKAKEQFPGFAIIHFFNFFHRNHGTLHVKLFILDVS